MIYTCPTAGAVFNGPHPEADDVEEPVTWFDIFSRLVGR